MLAVCGPCPFVCSTESLLSKESNSCILLVFLVNALNPLSQPPDSVSMAGQRSSDPLLGLPCPDLPPE